MHRSPRFWTVAILGLSFGLRLFLSLTADGLSGIDAGAYLNHTLGLLGQGVPDLDISRPPLAPGWLLVPFVQVFGVVVGYNLFSAVFAMSLPLAGAWVGWRLFTPWRAVAFTLIVAFDPASMGMMVTGVLPLIGTAIILLLSFCLWRISTEGFRWRYAVSMAALIPLLAFVNQTSAGLAVLVLGFQWLLLPRKRETMVPLVAGGIAALTALPWYLGAAPDSGRLTYPGPLILPHSIWEHQLWIGVAVLGVCYKAAKRPAFRLSMPWFRSVVYLVAALAIFQMFQSFNEVVMNLFFRSTYLMMPFLWLVVVWMLPDLRWSMLRKAAPATLAALMLVTVWQVRSQQDLSGYAPQALLDVTRQIESGPVVTNAQATAFVIGALTGQDVLWTHYIAPPPAFEQSDYRARCVLGWVPQCEPGQVRYVLVDERLPFDATGFAPDDLLNPYGAPERRPWAALANVPWLRLVNEQGPVKLYEVVHG